MEKAPGFRGFDLMISGERLEADLVHTSPDEAIKIHSKEKLPRNQWLHVLTTYDGSGKASGLKFYVNGRVRESEADKDHLTNSISNNEPVRIGARNGENLLKALVDDVRFYKRTLSAEDARLLTFNGHLALMAKSRGQRSEEERNQLQRFYKENYATDYLRSEKALAEARKGKE